MRTPYLPSDPLPGEDWSRDDPLLRRVLARRLPPAVWKDVEARLATLGRLGPEVLHGLARDADRETPTLREGRVVLSAPYLELQRHAREQRAFTYAWHPAGGAERPPRLAGFALGYLYAQAECGYYCPACMTDGAALVLERRGRPDLARRLVQDDPQGALEGAMFLTERTGGSDVGATTTVAEPGGAGGWRLTGDKWFGSNANAGVVLTLARMPGGAAGTRGLGLFLVEPPQEGVRIVRLKEKLGVRSMATGEFELRGAKATLLAGENEGFKAMAEMVNLSRLYNAVASVAIARRALREGAKNAAWREAFGKRLAEQPLYGLALAKLGVDVRGALAFVLDAADQVDAGNAKLLRALTPLAKAETARLAVRAASEACEMLGGNGYVQPWVTERLLRDAQVLPIWEGTTNVQALDFLRAATKDGAVEALAEDSLERARDPVLRAAWDEWLREVERGVPEIASARHMGTAYHLRAATLLDEDGAADGDPEARAFAGAYLARHVIGDEEAFEGAAPRLVPYLTPGIANGNFTFDRSAGFLR